MTRDQTRMRRPSASDQPDQAPGPRTSQSSGVWDRHGWLMAVVWMIFLVYPVLALLRSPAATGWIVTGWIALIVFAVLYVYGFIRGLRGGGGLGNPPIPGQWTIFALLIVCAILSVPAERGNALSFLPFIMSFASYGLTRAAHWITTVGAVALTTVAVLVVPGWLAYSGILAIVALLGVVNTVSTWLIIRSSQAEQLGLELASSEAREAVARDVHDLIGHSLTVVQLKSQLAARLIDSDPEQAKAELADITALTAEAIAGVRSTVSGARATTLVEQLASGRDALQSAGIALRIDGDARALSPVQSLTASWVLREAITNVLRHAQAKTVDVIIAAGRLIVADDGRGPLGAAGHDGSREGNGVRGMRERAAAAGASLAFGPGIEGGTRVELTW